MAIIFPPLNSASEEGLLAIGGNLDSETLLSAYTKGIFPWPISKESPLTWFSPDPRGIIKIDELHISKSFEKFLKKTQYTIKFNTNPMQVIHNCAKMKRKHEEGTWITHNIINAYVNFFKLGHVYTVEVYENEILIGGLYGVTINNYLSGESMFHSKPNASKLALYYLLQTAKKNSIPWIDIQMVTPVLESFGGMYIQRDDFVKMLNRQIAGPKKRSEVFIHSQTQLDQP